eukprot:Skav216193  [mRNA]  locus=scaffold1222:46317:47645:+ [translate_table: standard]
MPFKPCLWWLLTLFEPLWWPSALALDSPKVLGRDPEAALDQLGHTELENIFQKLPNSWLKDLLVVPAVDAFANDDL